MADKSTEEKKVVSLQEQVSSLFEGSELTEEMQEKVGTILEAVIKDQVAEAIVAEKASLQEQFDADLEDQMNELEEKVSAFLDHVVKEWMSENQLAVDSGIKTEIAESFITDMRKVMEAHDIDMPEGKVDELAEANSKLSDSEKNLAEAIKESSRLRAVIDGYKRDEVLSGLSEGLTDTQVEKFRSLTEDFAYGDSFESKAKTVRETFFKEDTQITEPAKDDDKLTEGKETDKNPMARYLSALA